MLTFGTKGILNVGVGAVEDVAEPERGAAVLSRRGVMLAIDEDLAMTSGLVGALTP